jgi:hypothetical protein
MCWCTIYMCQEEYNKQESKKGEKDKDEDNHD